MSNTLYINYVKISNVNQLGEKTKIDYALHIFNDWNETILEHSRSIQELSSKVDVADLLNLLNSFEDNNYYDSLLLNRGLNFNHNWYSLEELKKAELIKKCKSMVVPGHGPNFDKMTISELKNWLSIVEGMFEIE